MREIKFRCWDKENKEMLEVQELDYADSYDGQPMVRTTMYNDYFDTEDMILMQYVGIKDKNGKKIYEGDILQDSDCVYEVIFEYGCFDVKVIKVLKNVGTQKGLKYRTSFIVSDNDSIEIIRQ